VAATRPLCDVETCDEAFEAFGVRPEHTCQPDLAQLCGDVTDVMVGDVVRFDNRGLDNHADPTCGLMTGVRVYRMRIGDGAFGVRTSNNVTPGGAPFDTIIVARFDQCVGFAESGCNDDGPDIGLNAQVIFSGPGEVYVFVGGINGAVGTADITFGVVE